jgi:hypothetical protein
MCLFWQGGILHPTDNLESLHAHEEALREKSLAFIKADPKLSDHWTVLSEAMAVIYAFSHDHEHQSDNELTLQFLGIRLFNASGASITLALSGYYQKAFAQVRDILETYFLVDYLSTYPEKVREWKDADKRKRMAQFGPGFIRNALDKRDGYTSGARKKIYDTISEAATHASYTGFSLVLNDQNLGETGPFYNEKKLSVWLGELAMRFTHAAVILASNAEGQDLKLLVARGHYLHVANTWTAKYLQKKTAGGDAVSV